MKKVLVFGTFDLLHEGHKYLFSNARKYGDKLIVVVARDKNVEKHKKLTPHENENRRLISVMSTNFVDEVLLGNLENPYEILKEVMPDIICLGYDQNIFIDRLEDELKKIGLNKTKIIRIDAYKPEIYKSSKMREKLKK